MDMKVEVSSKYTVLFDDGRLSATRNGEPWRNLVGDGLVLSMAQRIEELEDFVHQACLHLSGFDGSMARQIHAESLRLDNGNLRAGKDVGTGHRNQRKS